MKVSFFVIFAAVIVSAYAAAGFAEYTIYSEKTCSSGNLLGLISDALPDVTNCVAAYCEQINATGQYRTTACLTSRTTPPANFIQANFFSDNTCKTATTYSALIPDTCVQVRDIRAVKYPSCFGGSFTQIQAASLADCNSGTSTTSLITDTTTCNEAISFFYNGVCAASNNPSNTPAKASSAVTAALSVLSVAAGFALVL